jgi:hypothetical protein
MDDKEKEILNEIMFGDKNTKIRLEFFIEHAIEYVNECEEDGDEAEMSEEFMRFLVYISNALSKDPKFYTRYSMHVDKFQSMINYDLANYEDTPVFTQLAAKQMNKNNELEQPMSSTELELLERTEILYNSHSDIISIFNNIIDPKIPPTWESLKKML